VTERSENSHSSITMACLKGRHAPGIVAWTTYVHYRNRPAEVTEILLPSQTSLEGYMNELHQWSLVNNMQINKQKMKDIVNTLWLLEDKW